MAEKKKVAKIYLNDPECKKAHLILDDLNIEDLEPLGDAFSVGDVLTIKVEEMDAEAFYNLPEFDGFY